MLYFAQPVCAKTLQVETGMSKCQIYHGTQESCVLLLSTPQRKATVKYRRAKANLKTRRKQDVPQE